MAGRVPEERVERPVILQGWENISFLHWRVDPERLARLLPDGLRPEVIDGAAWVSLTPFLVTGARPPGVPALPVVSQFPETNLRTYVTGPDGLDGLWFLSIEAASLPTTIGARAGYGAPYHMAAMSVRGDGPGGTVRYRSRRLPPQSPAFHDVAVTIDADPMSPTELDDALTGRWRAYTRRRGRLVRAKVEHEPWTLHSGAVDRLDQDLTERAGLPALGPPDLVHWSPGVHTRLSSPQPVGVAARAHG